MKTTGKKKAAKPAARGAKTPAHAYQEGSVESVGARPTGTDREDRSGDGTRRPSGKRAPATRSASSPSTTRPPARPHRWAAPSLAPSTRCSSGGRRRSTIRA